MAAEKPLKKLVREDDDEVVYKRQRETAVAVGETQISSEAPRRKTAPFSLSPWKREVLALSRMRAEVEGVSEYSFSIVLEARSPLPKLPPGYYFKGGAAREILREVLLPGTQKLSLRDYDLLRFTVTNDSQDHALGMRFMKGDYEFGRGVEVAESRSAYFKSRDLTVNEVLYSEGRLECSYSAARDMFGGVLRPTAHVMDAKGNVLGSTALKAMRLAAEALVCNVELKLVDFPEKIEANAFDVALHLDRALAIGEAVAQEYLFSVWSYGALLAEREVPPEIFEAVEDLLPRLVKGLSVFRHLPKEVLSRVVRPR